PNKEPIVNGSRWFAAVQADGSQGSTGSDSIYPGSRTTIESGHRWGSGPDRLRSQEITVSLFTGQGASRPDPLGVAGRADCRKRCCKWRAGAEPRRLSSTPVRSAGRRVAREFRGDGLGFPGFTISGFPKRDIITLGGTTWAEAMPSTGSFPYVGNPICSGAPSGAQVFPAFITAG